MRKYGKNGRLETVVCNMCGKKIVVKEGIVREGAAMIDYAWDYFSEKDGEVHHFDSARRAMMSLSASSGFRWTRKNRRNFFKSENG